MSVNKLFLVFASLYFSVAIAGDHHAAGVLPYYVDVEGSTWLLLGRENFNNPRYRLWSDFGGSAEIEEEFPYMTAAREGSEESRGVIGDSVELKNSLKKSTILTYLNQKRQKYYVLYLFQLYTQQGDNNDPCDRISEFYYRKNSKKYAESHFQEKDRIEWIRADYLVKAIESNNYVIRINHQIYPIRPCFFRLMQCNIDAFKSFLIQNYEAVNCPMNLCN